MKSKRILWLSLVFLSLTTITSCAEIEFHPKPNGGHFCIALSDSRRINNKAFFKAMGKAEEYCEGTVIVDEVTHSYRNFGKDTIDGYYIIPFTYDVVLPVQIIKFHCRNKKN